jgi:gliding motility-associated-like protein
MKQSILYLLTSLASLWGFSLDAQVHLKADFKPGGLPNFVNVCGVPDTATILISTNGLSPLSRTNIVTSIEFFQGVEMVTFLGNLSSPGVVLTNGSNPGKPIFSLPNLVPGGVTSVEITFLVTADCRYLDFIATNTTAPVRNTVAMTFNLGVQNGLTETVFTSEYRNALKAPNLTISAAPVVLPPAKVGQCFSRSFKIANSALEGITDTVIYSNKQGPGVSITAVYVEGVSIPFTKIAQGADTVITARISNIYLQLAKIGAGPGDGDVYFDPNESIVVKEDFCLKSCAQPRSSQHKASWGCKGRLCNSAVVDAFVATGQGAPNALITNTVANNITAGYCKPGLLKVDYLNSGTAIDPGFADMLNLEVQAGMNTFMVVDLQYVKATKYTVAGVVVPVQTNIVINNNPLFATDPDGPGIGLSDIDNDGFFDDLAPGKTFSLIINYEFKCENAKDPGIDNSCFNEVNIVWNTQLKYLDPCGAVVAKTLGNFGATQSTNDDVANCIDTDVFPNQKFQVRHIETRGVRGFEKSCGGGERFIVWAKLPSGITAIPSDFKIFKNNSTFETTRLGSRMSGDTLFVEFDATNPFLNGKYDIRAAFTPDCTIPFGRIYIPFGFQFSCPSCSCTHDWYCNVLEGPQFHPTSPPCATGISCPAGLQTTDFDVARTTFGFTGPDYTTRKTAIGANTDVAIQCDTVRMTVSNVVGQTPITDSIGLTISYDNVDFISNKSETFLFDKGILRINRGGTIFNCNIDKSMLQVQAGDTTKILTFNFNTCLVNLGITLLPGDSVQFYGDFLMNPNGAYLDNFKKIPNFRANSFAVINGNKLVCDNFGENFFVCKIPTVFALPGGSDFPKGCSNTPISYRLITKNVGFKDYYTNEFYPAVRIDSLVLEYDTNLISTFNKFEVKVSIPGHPVHGSTFFPIHKFSAADKGRYVARFDTLFRVPSHNVVQAYSFNLQVGLAPGCESLTGSAAANSLYKLNPTIYYADHYFANWFGDGSCSPDTAISKIQSLTYSDPPTVNFESVTNPSVTLAKDTAEWIVKQCNTSTRSDATLTWLSTVFDTTQLSIVSFELLDDPNNILSLPIHHYANGKAFAYTPGVLRQGGSNTPNQICNTIRIKAIPKVCGMSNVNLEMGWNCSTYDDPNWNPDKYTPCVSSKLALQMTVLDPLIEATVINQPAQYPSVCDTVTTELLVRNAGQGVLEDINMIFSIPLRANEYIVGSMEVAWPSNTPYVTSPGTPVPVGSNPKGEFFSFPDFASLHTGLDLNGLPGFDANNPTNSNEFKVRFKFAPGCSFVGGSQSFYQFSGKKLCSDPSNIEAGETLPIYFNNLALPTNKDFEVELGASSVLSSGANSTIEIDIINQSATVTDTFDKVAVKLPLGINYVSGSTLAVSPNNWVLGEPRIIVVNGISELNWTLPPGLQINDTATLRFQVLSPQLTCNAQLEAGLSTIRDTAIICPNNAVVCNSSVVTSGLEKYVSLAVGNVSNFAGADMLICVPGMTPIGSLSAEISSISWVPAALLNNPNSQTPIANIQNTTTFTATAIDTAGCTRVDQVIVTLAPVINSLITSVPASCGLTNGSINLSVTGGTGNFSYQWTPNTLTGLTPSNLSPGNYSVVITDQTNGCAINRATQVLSQGSPLQYSLTSTPHTPAINQFGTIQAVIQNGQAPYQVSWSGVGNPGSQSNISTSTYTINNLVNGLYTVTITDALGCSSIQTVVVQLVVLNNLAISVSSTPDAQCCVAAGTATINVFGGLPPYSVQIVNFTDTINQISPTTFFVPQIESGNYQVTVTDANGLTAQAQLSVVDACQCAQIFEDEVVYDVSGIESFCVPIPFIYINEYPIFINGQAYTGPYQGCDIDSVVYYAFSFTKGGGFDGPYKLNSWICNNTVITNIVFEDLYSLVDSMNIWDPNGFWVLDDVNSVIYGGDLDQAIYGDMHIMHMPTWQPYTMKVNYTDFAYGTEIYVNPFESKYVITAYDSLTCCYDSLCVILLNPCDDLIPKEPYIVNIDDPSICIPLAFADRTDYYVFVDADRIFQLSSCDNGNGLTVPIQPTIGSHTMIVIDTVGLCADTVPIFIIERPETDITYLSIPINTNIGLCASADDLIGQPANSSICGGAQYGNITTQSTLCWSYAPDQDFMGIDSVCIVACDTFGVCDTSIFVITIVPPVFKIQYLDYTMMEGTVLQSICIDTTELLGNIQDLNLCAPPLHGAITYQPINCMSYMPDIGFSGLDSACVLLCDDLGLCDTIKLMLRVQSNNLPPSPDTLRLHTFVNVAIPSICPVLSQIGGVAQTIDFCAPPAHGFVSFNQDCASYLPDLNFIGKDSFCLIVCSAAGVCDTTVVYIDIEPVGTSFTTDTVYLTTLTNVPTQWGCFSLFELNAPAVSFDLCTAPQNGIAYLSSPCFFYDPAFNFAGTDNFCLVACNAIGECDTIFVVVTVQSSSQFSPTRDTVYITTNVGTTTPTNCIDASQIGGSIYGLSLCTFPTNGPVDFQGSCFTYTPNPGFIGQDQFCSVACNAISVCDTTIYIISVIPLPVITIDTISLTTLVNTPSANSCTDLTQIGGTAASINLCAPPANGSVSLTSPCFVYTPNAGYIGNDQFCVVACNAAGLCDTTIVNVVVQPITPPPAVLDTIRVSTDFETPVIVCILNTGLTGATNLTFCNLPDNGNVAGLNDTCIVYEPNNLFVGFDTACVILCNTTGSCDTAVIIIEVQPDTPLPLNPDTLYVITPYQTTTPSICLNLTQLTGAPTSFAVCNQPNNGVIVQLNDTCLVYDPANLFIGQDTVCVIICDAASNCDTTTIVITVQPPALPDCDIFTADSITIEVFNGATTGQYCVDMPIDSVLSYAWVVNGAPYTGPFLGCDFDSCFDYTYFTIPDFGNIGPYRLNFWELNGQIITTDFMVIQDLVDSMNVWDPLGNWYLNPSTYSIVSCTQNGNVYGDIRITQLSSGGVGVIELNTNLVPNGSSLILPQGFNNVMITGTSGCSDTIVAQILPTTRIEFDTFIYLNSGLDTICLQDLGLNIAGITDVIDICPNNHGSDVDFIIDPITWCVSYEGLDLGIDSLCLKLLYGSDSCAYVNLHVMAIQPLPCINFIADSVANSSLSVCDGTDSTTICFNLPYSLLNEFTITTNGQPANTVACSPNPQGIPLIGVVFDTAGVFQVRFNRTILNCSDSLKINITCDLAPIVLFDTVMVGLADTICIDTSGYTGNIVSITNACANNSGSFVDFNLTTGNWCIVYDGIQVGTETACVVLCDQSGNCDTTLIQITVIPDTTVVQVYYPPIAVVDYDTLTSGLTSIIPVLSNDTLNGSLTQIKIIYAPLHGTAVIQNDNTILYTNDGSTCEIQDNFFYLICNDHGCDSAWVFIYKECVEFKIYNAFSPNGDMINDNFQIDGLELYPDNELQIFNRWGNRVHKAKNYQNNWTGVWNDQPLPNGVYFYLFDDGAGKLHSGSVTIMR